MTPSRDEPTAPNDLQIGHFEAMSDHLTDHEAASLTSGTTMWTGTSIKRIGIPAIKVTDGPAGARGSFWNGTTSACAPCGTALAATWNTELVADVGRVLGHETRSKGADMLLAPTVNLHRHPLAGRNFECFSEDPRLSALMAVAYINGLQSVGVSGCVKHFVANDQERHRHSISAEVDERTLRELYMLPFEASVRSADVGAVMTAYNALNGAFCAEHRWLLTDVLRNEWLFDGLVISDWWGVKSTEPTLRGGLDVEMPGPAVHLGDTVDLEVPEARFDVRRMARSTLRFLDRWDVAKRDPAALETSEDSDSARSTLRKAAAAAIVILSNDSPLEATGPLLPLAAESTETIGIFGPNALTPSIQGGGSAAVVPHYSTSFVDAVRAHTTATVRTALGVMPTSLPPLTAPTARRLSDGRPGIDIELFASHDCSGPSLGHSSSPQARVMFEGAAAPGVDQHAKSAIVRCTITPEVSGDHRFSLVAGEHGRLLVNDKTVLDTHQGRRPGHMFFGLGSDEETAVVYLDAGQATTIELRFEGFDALPISAFQIGYLPPVPADLMGEATDLAAQCDRCIVVVGLNGDLETEGNDRLSLSLPDDQISLIDEVMRINPNTVVLINAGAPVDMSWADANDRRPAVPAIGQLWYLGQEQGNAMADVIFGAVEPTGRLPMTIPRQISDTPAYANYPGEDTVTYAEGLDIGYRHYERNDIEVAYPFGWGLSYTTFSTSVRHLSNTGRAVGTGHVIGTGNPVETSTGNEGKANLTDIAEHWSEPVLRLEVDVTNTGNRSGIDVVQAYVVAQPTSAELLAPSDSPCRVALAGFGRIELAPDEVGTVAIDIPARCLVQWSTDHQRWTAPVQQWSVEIGHNARDRYVAGTIVVDDDGTVRVAADSAVQ